MVGDERILYINFDFKRSEFFLAEKALEYLKVNNPEKVKLFL